MKSEILSNELFAEINDTDDNKEEYRARGKFLDLIIFFIVLITFFGQVSP